MVTAGCRKVLLLTCVYIAYTSLQAVDVHCDAVHRGRSAATSPLLGCRLSGRLGCCQGQASPHTDVPLAADPGFKEIHLQASSLRLENITPRRGRGTGHTTLKYSGGRKGWSCAADSRPSLPFRLQRRRLPLPALKGQRCAEDWAGPPAGRRPAARCWRPRLSWGSAGEGR